MLIVIASVRKAEIDIGAFSIFILWFLVDFTIFSMVV
jgi:hypothetical protein